MLTYEEQKKAVCLHRGKRKTQKDISKILQVTPQEVKEGIIEFERQHKIKERKMAVIGDVIEFYFNGGLASGEVIKILNNSVIVEIIDMEKEKDDLKGKAVVGNSKYRVVNMKKIQKAE